MAEVEGGGGEVKVGGGRQGPQGGGGVGKGDGGKAEGGEDCAPAGEQEEAVSEHGDRGRAGVHAVPEDGTGMCVAKRRLGHHLQCLHGGKAAVWRWGGRAARVEKVQADTVQVDHGVRG